MTENKHNLIYQITNLINGKIYIGRHSTNNVNDSYFGSGKEIKKEVKLLGRESFKKEILFDFPTGQEMIDKEIELLTKEFVQQENNYNILDNTGGKGMLGKTHGEVARQKLREINTGLVSVKDKDGNNLKVTVDDPRYLSGELKHNTHGTVCVKDSEGNKFRVAVDDPRRISGELVGMNAGDKQTPERIQNRVEKNLEWWKENSHSEEGLQKLREANLKRVNVKDKDGNEFRVSCDDPRIESGELVNARKGNVWIHNKELQKSRFINADKVQEFLDNGWEIGLVYFNKKKRVWISNQTLQKSKQINEEDLINITSDWELGRISPENIGEKISNGRTPGAKWMNSYETLERKMILPEFIDEYLENGWKFGKLFLK